MNKNLHITMVHGQDYPTEAPLATKVGPTHFLSSCLWFQSPAGSWSKAQEDRLVWVLGLSEKFQH